MKGILKILTGLAVVATVTVSCVVHEPHGRRLPPGQAKKVYGGSARNYAPGQVKKKVYYYDNHRGKKKHKGHQRAR